MVSACAEKIKATAPRGATRSALVTPTPPPTHTRGRIVCGSCTARTSCVRRRILVLVLVKRALFTGTFRPLLRSVPLRGEGVSTSELIRLITDY